MQSVQKPQINGRKALNKSTIPKNFIVNTALAIFMLSLTAIYLRNSNRDSIDAVAYFKITVLENRTFSEVVIGLVRPGENGYFTSLFDLLLVKPLSSFMTIELAFQLVNLCVFFALGFLFLRLTSRFLKKTYAMFLTFLLLSTPTTGSFHAALFQIPDSNFGLSNIFFLQNSTSTRVLLALLFFFWVRTFNGNTKRQNRRLLSFSLIVVHLIHPICGAICLLSVVFMKSGEHRSFLKNFKEKSAIMLPLILLSVLQTISINSNLKERFNSILGGLGGRATPDYSFYSFVLYLALPILLLHISTKVINVSWYEIRSRFNFLFAPVSVQFLVVLIYILGWQNPLDVMNRNGLVVLINILSYVPLLYVLSQFSRANKLIFIRLRDSSRVIRIFELTPQVVTVLLTGAIFLQVSNSFHLREPIAVNSCSFLKGESINELNNLIMRSLGDEEVEIFEDTLSFVELNLIKRQSHEFLANPLTLPTSIDSLTNSCRFIGLGYLILNGFDQTDSARMKIDAFKKILESERKLENAS